MSSLRKIQFYPSIEKPYTLDKAIIDYPPKGYTFIGTGDNSAFKLAHKVAYTKWLRSLVRPLYHQFLKLFKTTAIFELTNKAPILDEADIVFSGSMIYDIQKPWVLCSCDHPMSLAGSHYELFMKNKSKIEKALLSPYCKKIIYTNQTNVDFMKKHFCKEVAEKVVLVDSAIKPIGKKKNYFGKKKRLLFMGSINNPLDFYVKGGLEAIKVFRALSKRKDVEFVIRCKVPDELREEIKSIPNLILIENHVQFKEIIKLYESSDILFMPGHNYSITTYLEGMSVGLPIIAFDTFAVKDYLKDGFNGCIIPRSDKIKAYRSKEALTYNTYIRTDEFMDVIKNLDDPALTKRLVKKIEYLLDHPSIIKKLGQNARREFFRRYSLKKRNEAFKKIFDEAQLK